LPGKDGSRTEKMSTDCRVLAPREKGREPRRGGGAIGQVRDGEKGGRPGA